MRARVSKSFKLALGVRARANAGGTMILGGKGWMAVIVLALGLAGCAGSNAASHWRTGQGGKDLTKVTNYLKAANQWLSTGQMQSAEGAGILLGGLADTAKGQPSPEDTAGYKTVMADLQSYGEALATMGYTNSLTGMQAALDKATSAINAHRADSWDTGLYKAMLVKVPAGM